MQTTVLKRSTDGTPEAVRQMHRQQAGRLLRMLCEHQDVLDQQTIDLMLRCGFTFWLDGRDA